MRGCFVLMSCWLSFGCATAGGQAAFYGSLAAVTSLPKLLDSDSHSSVPPRAFCNGSYCSMIEDCVGVLWFAHCQVSEHVRLEVLQNTRPSVKR